MKKLINDPRAVVDESVEGFGLAHADLVTVFADPKYIVRKDAPVAGKVGLVSGGGSGHEPLHGGYVGMGMLDAAVPGAVFTSPTPDQILPATLAVNSGAGVVHIVKNYTGDVLNFETAAELAQAEGVEVRTVLVNDDVAVQDSLYTAGRRGVGGTVLVEKIAGAAAERGDNLDAVAAIGDRVNQNVRSMGVALTACTVPHAGVAQLRAGGKRNRDRHRHPRRTRPAPHRDGERRRHHRPPAGACGQRPRPGLRGQSAPVRQRHGRHPAERALHRLPPGRAAAGRAGHHRGRSLVGNYITSLEMQGCSITVLRLDDEMTALWDAPVHTPALRWGV